MPEVKFVLNNPKTGRTYQKVLESNPYINKKIGDKISGNEIELSGYELEIRGGSDKSGCPMRFDMPGYGKKKALLSKGPCVHIKRKGKRVKKTVAGNTINEDIVQVNLKILKEGSKKINEIFPDAEKKEEAPKAEAV
ncbi:30S ribosomal protein S6e [Candidatus Woesearchaeota archaeon]|nr:30S ribosomal protein S6e [Candidatus Woesearchaeota archaeon]